MNMSYINNRPIRGNHHYSYITARAQPDLAHLALKTNCMHSNDIEIHSSYERIHSTAYVKYLPISLRGASTAHSLTPPPQTSSFVPSYYHFLPPISVPRPTVSLALLLWKPTAYLSGKNLMALNYLLEISLVSYRFSNSSMLRTREPR